MNYGKIKPVDVANGDGIRVSVFVSGCPHPCSGCFNQELWDYDAGEPFDNETILHILDLCSKDYITGLSLLGGEPLDPNNIMQMLYLCNAFKRKFPNKDIWCYTGYKWEDVKHLHIMNFIDVLVDGPYIEEQKDISLPFCGSRNQRLIDVKETLKQGTIITIQND